MVSVGRAPRILTVRLRGKRPGNGRLVGSDCRSVGSDSRSVGSDSRSVGSDSRSVYARRKSRRE
jgi:hypothetical protein